MLAEYQWRRGQRWETLAMTAIGEPQSSAAGSHEEFITRTLLGLHRPAFRVERVPGGTSTLESFGPRRRPSSRRMSTTLYGPEFVEPLSAPPVSAFIAEGSHVEVRRKEAPEAL